MAKLTIDLSDERHEKLRARAAASGCSIGEVIEGELEDADAMRIQRLRELIELARRNGATGPQLSDDQLMELGMGIAHEVREQMMREGGRA